jgi:hypothetical protein
VIFLIVKKRKLITERIVIKVRNIINKDDKKSDFNLLINSSSNGESDKNKLKIKIEEEIQFKNSYEDTFLNVIKK